jgi:ABC-type cobalt transport system substrate-binding protein
MKARSRSTVLMLALSCALLLCLSAAAHAAPEKWQGVDETVVEKYAVEHGRPPKTHLIEPTGDVLLFAFLIAGTVGGFILGYYYREFTKKDSGGKTDEG